MADTTGGGGAQAPAPKKREKNRYRATLNLPSTGFAMKANLVQNEPASLKRWANLGLYERLRERCGEKSRGRFVFHDGPPYANGSIHLGHLLNKCLKDFVVRSRQMAGFDCPYVPGWDCHGLPIEHKVMGELVESGKIEKLNGLDEDVRRLAIRRECEKYAKKFHKLQTSQMERLLTIADYAHPYLTMHHEYEGAVIETLAGMVERGLVFRALKPVHWSIANETALAEAELEYMDRVDPSVYVDFEAAEASAVYDAFGLPAEGHDTENTGSSATNQRPAQTPSFMIWTTTPWTLPANMAIAVHPRLVYALVRMDGNVTVVAKELIERVTKIGGAEDVEVLAETSGANLVGLRYRHAFCSELPEFGEQVRGFDAGKVWTVVGAEYVTIEDGTGLVHTATGHGSDDFNTGLREGLPTYCPVRANGTYDATVPDWLRGVGVFEANDLVVRHLRESGHLFCHQEYSHSYPHDWRSKTPVIFRATEQWFIGVDQKTGRDGRSLREMAMEAVVGADETPADAGSEDAKIRFVPEWGRNRMRGMLENRPDWCISRQRAWGLPIPAFFTPDGDALLTPASVRAVARVFREEGSDAWYKLDAAALLRHYDAAGDAGLDDELRAKLLGLSLETLTKSGDILDVWFESGSSWNAVMRERSKSDAHPDGEDYPIDLYLEGSDQHRGWFQSSLLPGLAVTGRPPYKTVLTHGFMVGRDGLKLSKSKGHTIESLFEHHGADVLRWWVASLAYEGDMKVDEAFFGVAGESYRKIRNTLRFLLGNVGASAGAESTGGAPAVDSISPTSLEAWVLGEFDTLRETVLTAFERYDFRAAQGALYDLCNDTLSSVYLAAIKDRLYCDEAASERRVSAQRTLRTLGEGLCRLLAPILCHTADEAYRVLVGADPKDTETCVHLLEFPCASGTARDPGWGRVMEARGEALLALERAKQTGLENPLDAGIALADPDGVLARFDPVDLADLCGVSLVTLVSADQEVRVEDLRERFQRCERSWKRGADVRERSDGGVLSDRDAAAVGVR